MDGLPAVALAKAGSRGGVLTLTLALIKRTLWIFELRGRGGGTGICTPDPVERDDCFQGSVLGYPDSLPSAWQLVAAFLFLPDHLSERPTRPLISQH